MPPTPNHQAPGATRPGPRRRLCVVAVCCLGVVAGILAAPCAATAAEVQVTSHTVGQVFDYVAIDGRIVPHQRFTERLGVNVWDVLGDGANRWRFQSALAVDTNLGLRDEDRDAVPALARRFNAATLHYAFLEGRQVLDRLDLKLGRALLTDTLGWLDLDGAWASLRVSGGFSVEAVGGLEVKQDVFALNDAAFDPDGTDPYGPGLEPFDTPIAVVGAGVGYRTGDQLSTRLAYRRHLKTDSGDVEQERLGAEATGKLGPVSLAGDLVWNAFVARIERADAAVDLQLLDTLRLGVAYARRLPVFDADSIFNVFDVRAYDDARLEARWAPSRRLSVSARTGARLYGLATPGDGAPQVALLGRVSAAWSPWSGVWTRATHQTEAGDTGRKHYSALFASSPRYFDTVSVSGALVHVAFASQHRRALEGHGFGAQLAIDLHLGELGDLRAVIDQAVNPLVDQELRVLMILELDTWL